MLVNSVKKDNSKKLTRVQCKFGDGPIPHPSKQGIYIHKVNALSIITTIFTIYKELIKMLEFA